MIIYCFQCIRHMKSLYTHLPPPQSKNSIDPPLFQGLRRHLECIVFTIVFAPQPRPRAL
jgi:hypothetical protein